jgi:hypothetical protein
MTYKAGRWIGRTAGLADNCRKEKTFLALFGIKPRFLGCSASSLTTVINGLCNNSGVMNEYSLQQEGPDSVLSPHNHD